MEDQVQFQVVHVGFVVDIVTVCQVFLQALWFSISIIIPQIRHTQLASGAGTLYPFETAEPKDSFSPHS